MWFLGHAPSCSFLAGVSHRATSEQVGCEDRCSLLTGMGALCERDSQDGETWLLQAHPSDHVHQHTTLVRRSVYQPVVHTSLR